MEPLTPELAMRLISYLRARPEISVLWRKDQRVWIFVDDDPDSPVTEVAEADLGAYLDAQANS
jgi:hypothetical protein